MKKFKYLQYGLHVLVLLGLIAAGVKYVNGGEFLRAIHTFNWIYAPLILASTIAYLGVKGWRFVYQMRQMTEANGWVVFRAYVAGQACTLVPGGIAARAGILKQAGVPVADSAASVAMSSLLDQLLLMLCSLVAALWFETARKPVLILLAALFVISLILGIEASRTWLLGIVEKLMGRFNQLERWRDFKDSVKEVLTLPMISGGLLNTAVSFALMVEALHLATVGVGASVPYFTLLLAFTLPSLMGRISAMPGGVGVTEAGMIGILNAAPDVTLHQAAAAVTIFRIGTTLFAAMVGGAMYFFGWQGEAEAAY